MSHELSYSELVALAVALQRKAERTDTAKNILRRAFAERRGVGAEEVDIASDADEAQQTADNNLLAKVSGTDSWSESQRLEGGRHHKARRSHKARRI